MTNNVICWLEKAKEKYPGKTAVHDENGDLSFGELADKAKRAAYSICNITGNAKRKPVAVFIPKSREAVTAFMSAVYSGNFYVSIDTEMPAQRFEKIINTLKPELIITTEEYKEKLEGYGFGLRNVVLSDITKANYDENVIDRNISDMINTDILYVIFTSGSTGTPKGVAVTHRGVINYIEWVEDCFGMTADDSLGNQAPFYFDNSVLDIYTMLKTGATLYIVPHILYSQPVRLLEYIKTNAISTIFWVPSAMIMVSRLRAFKNVDVSGCLKKVLFAGEVMPTKQLNEWIKYIPNAVYANLYGPTEITVDCTYYIVDRKLSDDEPVPIGNKVYNTEILVLDDNDNLVTEPDVIGELCVRGAGLALGYYNNPEKTKEVFVQNPLNSTIPEIIYRTGDLVKYNDRGEIIYVTRKDYQIKHLGHRIELGEIEAAASVIDGINQCCCVYDDKRSRIVMVIEGTIDRQSVIDIMRESVPNYMLPGEIIFVDSIPLNANGKMDRVKVKENYL